MSHPAGGRFERTRVIVHLLDCGAMLSFEIRDGRPIADDLVGLDDAGPPGHCGHVHAALKHIALATTKCGVRVLGEEIEHGAVVTHPHHESVLGDSQVLEGLEELPHIVVMLHELVAGVGPLC